MTLELNDKEKEVLKLVLELFDEELKDEIGRTDRREWKTTLHGEETVVKSLLAKVS
jgi:hypothetical protein